MLKNEIRDSYTQLFEMTLKDRSLYCFGAGSIMESILEGFKYKDKLAGIFDHNESKWGSALNGFEILPPRRFSRADSERTVVLITADCYEDIKKRLDDMGIQYVFYYAYIVTNTMNVCRGNYADWNEAMHKCRGYHHDFILRGVEEATRKVLDGEALFERDSVLFNEREYQFHMAASLLYVYAREGNLSALDFGGALGSLYFQNKELFPDLNKVEWNIVEQSNFAARGTQIVSLREKNIRFFSNIDRSDFRSCNCLILSSSIEYVEDPYACLRSLLDLGCKYILLDKMPLIEGEDRLCIQATPLGIYDADYPLWLLNRDKFMKVLQENYETVFKWEMESNLWLADDETEAVCRGCLLRAR